MRPRVHLTLTLRLGPLRLGGHPPPGWGFMVGGGTGPGCFLVQVDDEERLWYERFWSVGSSDRLCLMIGVRSHVDQYAAESMGRYALRRSRP